MLLHYSSRRSTLARFTAVAFFSFAGLTACRVFSTSAFAADWEVVATGLNNPRGLDFAPNGALYIAEAGAGGDGPIVQMPDGPGQLGLTGSITRVFNGRQERVTVGLPSLAAPGGFRATGPTDVSFERFGHARVTFGSFGGSSTTRDALLGAAGSHLGWVFQFNQNGTLKPLADLAAFETRVDPDGQGPESNPNGVLADTAGGTYVADAAANALFHINAKGMVTVVAVFPNRFIPTPPDLPQPPFPPQMPINAVPTNVVFGPDGALYVSQLTGFPFPAGGARIYRVVPGAAPEIYAEGFTNVIDLDFDAAGNLYVLEIDRFGLRDPQVGGRLARINAADHSVETIADDGLVMPGGIAIGPDGAIYVSNFGISPGGGEVVRIQP